MSFEREEYLASLGNPAEPIARTPGLALLIEQASVSAERLTQNDDWNKFLSYLEKKLADIATARAKLVERIAYVGQNDSDNRPLVNQLIVLKAQEDVLKWVMALPKQLQVHAQG